MHARNDYVAMIREFESLEVEAVAGRYEAFVNALSGYYSRRLNEGV
jgi:Txe/YoeB family toxin of Txe-Axe toxin-antitoxin module